MFAQWWRDVTVLSTFILQRFPTRTVAASKSHHCANTNVVGKAQKKKSMTKHKDYLIGAIVSVIIGATALAFQPTSDQFALPVQIILGALTALIICSLIALIILGVSWIFTKDFSLFRFIRIGTIVCVVWAIFSILSFIKSLT